MYKSAVGNAMKYGLVVFELKCKFLFVHVRCRLLPSKHRLGILFEYLPIRETEVLVCHMIKEKKLITIFKAHSRNNYTEVQFMSTQFGCTNKGFNYTVEV